MRPSMSKLPLLARCQWWARPDVTAPTMAPSAAMQLGTAVHAAIERRLRGEPTPDLEVDADELFAGWREWWATEGAERFGADGWLCEVALAYRTTTDTARELGDVRGRAYPTTAPDEIVGTVDAVRVTAGRAIVIDWKTGDDRQRLTEDAADNRQLRGYALAVSRAYGVDDVTVAVVRIGSSGVTCTAHDLDAFDLAHAADDLRRQLADVPTAHPAPGLHCARCPAVSVCPATIASTDQLAPRAAEGIDAPPEPVPLVVTADNAAPLLARLRAVQAACDHVEAALRAYATTTPGGVPLPDGRRWGRVTSERSSIVLDGPEAAVALAVLDTHGVSDAVERTARTSRAAIERAVTAQGAKGKEKTSRVLAVLDELRACGAMRTAVVETFREAKEVL